MAMKLCSKRSISPSFVFDLFAFVLANGEVSYLDRRRLPPPPASGFCCSPLPFAVCCERILPLSSAKVASVRSFSTCSSQGRNSNPSPIYPAIILQRMDFFSPSSLLLYQKCGKVNGAEVHESVRCLPCRSHQALSSRSMGTSPVTAAGRVPHAASLTGASYIKKKFEII